MLDILFIKKNLSETITSLKKKNFDAEKIINKLLELDNLRIRLQKKSNLIQEKININSKKIGDLYKNNNINDAKDLKSYGSKLKEDLKEIIEKEKKNKIQIHNILVTVPNIPNSNVPQGKSEKDNQVEKTKTINFISKSNDLSHWDLAKKYDLIDFEKGTVITGSGFPLYKNKGAVMQRALINFFLEFNTKLGYSEYIPPLLVNPESAFGTGNLPDKDGQMYHVEKDDLYLIPTAEVPLTNFHRDEIIDSTILPLRYTAFTNCFRSEAGAAGKDTKGLMREHQFGKVELVSITEPNHSMVEMERMIECVQMVLKKLELPYRLVELCSTDLGFSSSYTIDLEVWMPGQNKFREVSSCSNCKDFQSRRMNMRAKNHSTGEIYYPHTLNGSSIAVGRILISIVENYQEENGTISVPEILKSYMKGKTSIG